MNGARKGSAFERKICKELSLWWTHGKRDDVFWRSSQSGGRATKRSAQGKKTAGSYGDITALDPIGKPFLDLFTVELKVGKSHGHPMEMLDAPRSPATTRWERTLAQAIQSHQEAGSGAWLLICQRNRRIPMVYVDARVVLALENAQRGSVIMPPCARYTLMVCGTRPAISCFYALSFSDFFERFRPEFVTELLDS